MSAAVAPHRSDQRTEATTALAVSGVVTAIGALYFGLFNHDFSVNGLRYAGDVERGADLFHPNHLLPGLIHRWIYLVTQALGLADLRAIWSMQALNVCIGLVAVGAIARIAVRRGGTLRGVLVAALYALGFAAWNFAEEPDVYIMPAAAVMVSVALLATRERLSWPAITALGVAATFAVLTLQQYALWYPALILLVARRDLGAARRSKLLALALGVPLACLCSYVAIGLMDGKLHDSGSALGWFLGYAWDPQRGFGVYRAAPAPGPRLLGALLGLANLVFAYEVILAPLAIGAAAVASALLLWLGARTTIGLRAAPSPRRRDAAIVAGWLLASLLFAIWWESRNIEFLFPVWVGACLLLAMAADVLDRRVLAVAVVAVGAINLAVSFWPERAWPARYRVAEELARSEHLTSADVLITEELNTIGYLKYFDHVDVRFQPGAVSAAMHASVTVAEARKQIDQAVAAGARVYTTEIDEHGRLREIAHRFALLGREGFDGAIDRDTAALYAGLDVSERPVPGVRRVRRAQAQR